MKKNYALLSSLLLTLVAANIFYLSAEPQQITRERATVTRVIDGDTIDTLQNARLCIAYINAPENGKPGYAAFFQAEDAFEDKTLEAVLQGSDKSGSRTVARL